MVVAASVSPNYLQKISEMCKTYFARRALELKFLHWQVPIKTRESGEVSPSQTVWSDLGGLSVKRKGI